MNREPIRVGEPAPDFTLENQEGKSVYLGDFKGQPVVLVFYPLDFSPVCSKEHVCFVNELKRFETLNAVVLGISVDSKYAHKAFAEKMNINYNLLADFHPKGEVARKYGLYLEDLGITNRATVVIDGKGIVRYVHVNEIPEQRDLEEIIAILETIRKE